MDSYELNIYKTNFEYFIRNVLFLGSYIILYIINNSIAI